jgi:peptidoglycan/xylan/chitin deacetylase (PgdA/CDA1 family)
MITRSSLKQLAINLTGISWLRWHNRPIGLYCFNYHRVGDADSTPYDPNVFSCTAERFEQHVRFYNENFDVINIDELLSIVEKERPISARLALISFDDGYIDNYELAFPILKKHNTPATFFISTNYIDHPEVPWWDEIAWMIRQSDAGKIRLSSWRDAVPIDRQEMTLSISNVLKAFKRDQGRTMADKISELRQILDTRLDTRSAADLFVSWEMIREMVQSKMDIGSHSCSHRMLSHISVEDQADEVTQSKHRLESQLGREIAAFAYPVGGRDSFTHESREQLQKAGYKIAFSFIKGINLQVHSLRYELRRLGI